MVRQTRCAFVKCARNDFGSSEAADQDESWAENGLGWFYEQGLGGFEKDAVTAVSWYRKAADQSNSAAEKGETTAYYTLGVEYETGDGAPRDLATAQSWYQVDSDCADGQQLCKKGSFLCGVYRRDFIKHDRTCPGVTDIKSQ